MREFEMFEIRKQKCFICGCKNKVHTEILDNHDRLVGYSLKCCGCGGYKEFFIDAQNNGKPHPAYHNGKQTCIMMSFCPHRECPIRNNGNMSDNNMNQYEHRMPCGKTEEECQKCHEVCDLFTPHRESTSSDIEITLVPEKHFL